MSDFTPAPILFRVWDGERMHYPGDSMDMISLDGHVYAEPYGSGDWARLRVPLLFTGLHDADGCEVFEGDLLADDLNPSCVGTVSRIGSSFGTEYVDPLPDEPSRYRVVGNVYEGVGEPA